MTAIPSMDGAAARVIQLRAGATARWRGNLGLCLALIVIYGQLLMFGADSGVLASVFACLEVVLAALCLLVIGDDLTGRFWRAMATPLALVVAAMAWAALGARLSPILAPDAVGLELAKLCGLMGLIVCGALIGRDRSRFEALGLWLAIVGLSYALLSLALARADPLTVWGQSKGAHTFRFTGTLTNANAAGCVFGMIALVAMGCGASLVRQLSEKRASLWAYLRLALVAAAAFAALLAAILTESRTALVTVTLFSGLIIISTLRRRRWLRPAPLLILTLCLAAGVTLGMAQVGWRWETVALDFSQRMMGYGHFFRLAALHPLFGIGLGGFRALNQAALTPASAPYLWDYGAAHMAILQAALEGGWPYALLLLAATLALAVPVLLVRTPFVALGGVASGMMAAAVLAGVCSMDDIALNVPAISALAALLLGASLGASVPRRRRQTTGPDHVLAPDRD